MSKPPLRIEQVLASVANVCGRSGLVTATRLLTLGESLGGQLWPRHQGVSARLPGTYSTTQEWVTLFVLSTLGTVYNDWIERWPKRGVPRRVASEFRSSMTRALGDTFELHPSQYAWAPQLSAVRQHWTEVEAAILRAAVSISAMAEHGERAKRELDSDIRALEGQATESRVIRRYRSGALRRAALIAADGTCEACGTNYGELLGNVGRRVLQVHHRRQLAAAETPRINDVSDLAVVCANCHLLIHADTEAALSVEALRSRWQRLRSGNTAARKARTSGAVLASVKHCSVERSRQGGAR